MPNIHTRICDTHTILYFKICHLTPILLTVIFVKKYPESNWHMMGWQGRKYQSQIFVSNVYSRLSRFQCPLLTENKVMRDRYLSNTNHKYVWDGWSVVVEAVGAWSLKQLKGIVGKIGVWSVKQLKGTVEKSFATFKSITEWGNKEVSIN